MESVAIVGVAGIVGIAERKRQIRHRDAFGQEIDWEKADRKDFRETIERLWYKWGGKKVKEWFREICEKL